MFNILGNLGKFYDIFTKGKEIYQAVFVKKTQVSAGLISAFLAACIGVARSYGYELPFTDNQLVSFGITITAILGLFHSGATVASTDKIGLPPRKQPDANSDPVSDPRLSAVSEPEPQAPVQSEHKTLARVAGELVDSDNPLAGLDTTYRG